MRCRPYLARGDPPRLPGSPHRHQQLPQQCPLPSYRHSTGETPSRSRGLPWKFAASTGAWRTRQDLVSTALCDLKGLPGPGLPLTPSTPWGNTSVEGGVQLPAAGTERLHQSGNSSAITWPAREFIPCPAPLRPPQEAAGAGLSWEAEVDSDDEGELWRGASCVSGMNAAVCTAAGGYSRCREGGRKAPGSRGLDDQAGRRGRNSGKGDKLCSRAREWGQSWAAGWGLLVGCPAAGSESPLRGGKAHPSAEVLLPSAIQQWIASTGASSSTGSLPCSVASVALRTWFSDHRVRASAS